MHIILQFVLISKLYIVDFFPYQYIYIMISLLDHTYSIEQKCETFHFLSYHLF